MNRRNFCNANSDTVNDCLQALEAYNAKNNAVLISDCHMPKRDDFLPEATRDTTITHDISEMVASTY